MKIVLNLIFVFLVALVRSQEISADCKLAGDIFHPTFDYYYGNCFNNKANGFGKLFLKNGKGIYSGFFSNNNLLDFGLELYSPKDSVYIIGPNKSALFQGPCMKINIGKQIVSLVNFNNGSYLGNDPEYFKINSPEFKLNEKFCIENLWATKDAITIPGTKKIIFVNDKTNSDGSVNGKVNFWISLVDLENNSVIFNYGNNSSPLKTKGYTEGMPFIGFSADNNFAFFKLNYQETSKIIRCDLRQGGYSLIQSLPIDILKKGKLTKNIIENKVENFNILNEKFKVLSDSSIILILNNPEYGTSMRSKIGGGSILLQYNKDLSIRNKVFFPFSTICDFDVSENLGKIVIIRQTQDSTFLSYHSIDKLEKLNNVIAFKNQEYRAAGKVTFSEKGIFLVYSSDKGNLLFKNDNLFFGLPGKLIGFNSNENTAIVLFSGVCRAYDLIKKNPIWQFKVDEQAFCHQFENDLYFLSNQDEKKIFRIDCPDTNSLVNSFIVDYTKTVEYNDAQFQKNSSQSISQSNQANSSFSSQIKDKEVLNTNPSEPKYIVKIYRVNNGNKTSCKWCAKSLVCSKKTELVLKNEENLLLNNPFGQFGVALDIWKASFEGRIIDNGNGTKTHKFPLSLYDCPTFCSLKCAHEYKVSGY